VPLASRSRRPLPPPRSLEGGSRGHLVRGRGGPLPAGRVDSTGEMAGLALAYCVDEGNADHYQVSLVCWFRAGAWFTAGLAGSDRWPSSMSGGGMVGRPAARIHRDLDLGSPWAGLARGGATLSRSARGVSSAAAGRPGQKAVVLPVSFPWRSCGPLARPQFH